MDRNFVKHYKLHGEETIYRWMNDDEGIVRVKNMDNQFIIKEINYIKDFELKNDEYFNGAISVFEDVLLQRRKRKINKIRQRYAVTTL